MVQGTGQVRLPSLSLALAGRRLSPPRVSVVGVSRVSVIKLESGLAARGICASMTPATSPSTKVAAGPGSDRFGTRRMLLRRPPRSAPAR
jgi:hypothetical protein